MDVSVILPIHNELENLEPLLDEIDEALGTQKLVYEIVAVDDGSTDGSAELLERLAESRDSLKVVLLRRNFGQTAAFSAGFKFASGEVLVTMDSDRQNDPKDIPALLKEIENGADYVTGWRRDRKDRYLLRKFPSLIANGLIRRVTGTSFKDLGCSLKAYRREIVEELSLYGEMHRFIGPIVEGMGARVAEIPVNHRPRVAGESKYGLMRTFKVLLDLLTVWFMNSFQTKPIYVFGGAASGLLAASAALVAYVGYQKLALAVWVHKNPLFLIAIVFALMGVQLLGMGLLAEIQIRTYFESRERKAYSVRKSIGFDAEEPPCAE